MLKKIFILFMIFGGISFSRYVNKCKVLSRDYNNDYLVCRSLESGKNFRFYMPWNYYVGNFTTGRVYKIWFEEVNGYYLLNDAQYLY